ncbi:hypothetical protein IC235_21765, partial [Hymenobacter sp. BT664]|nr:hypothetical protein [Hymenobacter montanus]
DIQNGVMSEKGQRLLAKYQNGDFNAIMDNEPAPRMSAAATSKATDDAYGKLLD